MVVLVFALVDSVFGLEESGEGPRSRLLTEAIISAEDAIAVQDSDRQEKEGQEDNEHIE